MRRLVTTELHLHDIVLSEGIWTDIVKQQDEIYISHDENYNNILYQDEKSAKIIQGLHKGHTFKIRYIYDDMTDGTNILKLLRNSSATIFLLDISKEKANEISDKYGVMCYAIEDTNIPVIAKRGWNIDTSDASKPKTWEYMLDDANKNFTSLVIIDRFLYSSEQPKNETFCIGSDSIDTDYNLTEILDNVLSTQKERENGVVISFLFSDQKAHDNEHDYHFGELVNKIGNIISDIKRPYKINYEIIGINKDMAYYNDTHDRFVFSNYFIMEASHMLKAFRNGGSSLTNQKLTFDYLYSRGIGEDTKSSMPVVTQERVIRAIQNFLQSERNKEKIKYAYNGDIKENIEIIKSKNYVLASKIT